MARSGGERKKPKKADLEESLNENQEKNTHPENGDDDNNLIGKLLEFGDSSSWDMNSNELIEIRRRLKKICSQLAEIEFVDSKKEKELCICLENIAIALCDSGLMNAPKGKKKAHVESDLMIQPFTACALVELFRIIDMPFMNSIKKKADAENYIVNCLEFFLRQIKLGIMQSGAESFPLHFHVLEVLSHRSTFLLISRLQKESTRETMMRSLFQNFVDVSSHSLLPQIKDFLVEILKDVIQEPETVLDEDVIVMLLTELVNPKSDHSKKLVERLLLSCESRLTNDVNDVLQRLSDFQNENDDMANPESFCQLVSVIGPIMPTVLNCIVPTLCDLLNSDDLDVRLNLVNLFGDLLSNRDIKIPDHSLLSPFLRRFVDIDSSVRLAAVERIKDIIDIHVDHSAEILEHLKDRLLDPADEKVRQAACSIFCEICRKYPMLITNNMLESCCSRVLDKSAAVRKRCIADISDIFIHWSKSEMIDKRKIILSYMLKAAVHTDTWSIVQQVLIDKILLPSSERFSVLLDFYRMGDSFQRKQFCHVFIQKKFIRAKKLNEWLDSDGEISQHNLSLEKSLAPTVHFSESEFRSFLDNQPKIVSWLRTVTSMNSTYDEIAVSIRELTKLAKGTPFESLLQDIIIKTAFLILSPRDFEKAVHHGVDFLKTERSAEAATAFELAKRISQWWKVNLSMQVIEKILDAFQEHSHGSRSIIFFLESLANIEQLELNETIVHFLLKLARISSCSVARLIALIILRSPTFRSSVVDEAKTLSESLSIEDEKLANKLAIISQVLSLTPQSLVSEESDILEFILHDLLSAKVEVLKRGQISTESSFDSDSVQFNGTIPPLFQNLSSLSFAKARGLDVFVAFLRAKYKVNLDRAKEIFTGNCSLLLTLLSTSVPEDEVMALSVDDNSFIVSYCLRSLLELLCSQQLEFVAPVSLLESLVRLMHSPSRLVRENLIESLYSHLQVLKLNIRYVCILALSAVDPVTSIHTRAKHYLIHVLQTKKLQLRTFQKNAANPSKALIYTNSPEYSIWFLIYFIGSHPSFTGDADSCYQFLPCLQIFFDALIASDQTTDFSLIMAVLGTLRRYEVADDSSRTIPVYILTELVQELLQHQYKGKEWNSNSYTEQIALPSKYFIPRSDGHVDNKIHIPAEFSMGDKRARHRILDHATKQVKVNRSKTKKTTYSHKIKEQSDQLSSDESGSDSSPPRRAVKSKRIRKRKQEVKTPQRVSPTRRSSRVTPPRTAKTIVKTYDETDADVIIDHDEDFVTEKPSSTRNSVSGAEHSDEVDSEAESLASIPTPPKRKTRTPVQESEPSSGVEEDSDVVTKRKESRKRKQPSKASQQEGGRRGGKKMKKSTPSSPALSSSSAASSISTRPKRATVAQAIAAKRGKRHR